MVEALARNWGMIALRGVVAILFGLATLFNPALTLVVLIFFFGGYALIDGFFTVIAAIANRGNASYWLALVFSGLVGIAIGITTFFMPGITAMALLYLIAAWAIVIGVTQIVAAVRLRREISGEWLLALAGVISVLFGAYLVFFPGSGALAITLWIGAYAVVIGIVQIALAFRLRSWQYSAEHDAAPTRR